MRDDVSSATEESQGDYLPFNAVEFKPVSYEQLLSGDCCLQDIDLKPLEHLMYGEDEGKTNSQCSFIFYQFLADDIQHNSRHCSPAKRKAASISENIESQSSSCYGKRIKTEDEIVA